MEKFHKHKGDLTLFQSESYTAIKSCAAHRSFVQAVIVNLPNTLTLLRIFIVPLLVVVLLTPFSESWFGVPRHILGVFMFLAAALTDYLDGHIARRRGQVTRLGQLLDPIADKLLISAALISLVENQLAPAWAVVIIIGREFAVTGLRSIAAVEGVVISASKMGKFKMLAQVVTITLLIGSERSGQATRRQFWETFSSNRVLVGAGIEDGLATFNRKRSDNLHRLAGTSIHGGSSDAVARCYLGMHIDVWLLQLFLPCGRC